MSKNKKTVLIVIGVLLLCGLSGAASEGSQKQEQKTEVTPTATVVATPMPTAVITETQIPTPTVTKTPQEQIEGIVYKTAKYSVLIFDDANRMDSKAKPPFDVIVNTYGSEAGNPTSCTYAKNVVYQIIKNLYADKSVRPTLGRVLVNASPYVSGSLGANDGVPAIEKDATLGGGPTNFWTVLSATQSYADNDMSLKNRTWGETLSGCR